MRHFLFFLLALALAAPAAGQQRQRTGQVEAEVVPETRSVRPGEPVRVAVRLGIRPGWHIYAREPGEIGLPTAVRWRGPAGLRVVSMEWPPAERTALPGGTAWIYQGEVVVVTTLHPPPLKPGEVLEMSAEVAWGVCREVCLPQRARLGVRLPVRDAAPRSNARWRALVAEVASPATRPALPPAGSR